MITEQEIHKKLADAIAFPAETEIVEFKEAKNSYDFDKIGKYFSALSNEANLKGESCAWLIFGIEDTKHQIVGSHYRIKRKDLDSLKKEIGDKTTHNISFTEIYEINKPEGRVIMFQIPAAPQGIPVAFEGFYYGRASESLVALNIEKIERIRNQVLYRDWSRNIVPDATIKHLDKEAILKAREHFKIKNPSLLKETDNWTDAEFLDKARITLDGKITNTAIVAAMVNLNMIDTIGSGIKRIFTIQRERFFPMPTYDISNESHTEVKIYGEPVNNNFTRILYAHPELSLDDVIALDKVQKKIPVGDVETARLRELKLVAGLTSALQVAGKCVKA